MERRNNPQDPEVPKVIKARIMLSSPKDSQYGREIMAHRWQNSDKRDAQSTRVMVHSNSFSCNIWELHQFEGDVFRIMLSANQVNTGDTYNQQNWILNAQLKPTDGKGFGVFLDESPEKNFLWKVKNVGGGNYEISLFKDDHGIGLDGWNLVAKQSEDTNRNSLSNYLYLSKPGSLKENWSFIQINDFI